MSLHEKNINKAFAFGDILTKRNAAIILIAGRAQDGTVYFAHDDNMPKEVLIEILLKSIEGLKQQKDTGLILPPLLGN